MRKIFNLSVADEMNLKTIMAHHTYLRGNSSAAMSLALFETAAAIVVTREGTPPDIAANQGNTPLNLVGCVRCSIAKNPSNMVTNDGLLYCHNCYDLLGHAGLIDPFKDSVERNDDE